MLDGPHFFFPHELDWSVLQSVAASVLDPRTSLVKFVCRTDNNFHFLITTINFWWEKTSAYPQAVYVY
jgi:hypothetical protein